MLLFHDMQWLTVHQCTQVPLCSVDHVELGRVRGVRYLHTCQTCTVDHFKVLHYKSRVLIHHLLTPPPPIPKLDDFWEQLVS